MRERNGIRSDRSNSKNISKRKTAIALTAAVLVSCAGITWIVRAHNQPVDSLTHPSAASVHAVVAGPTPRAIFLKPNQKPTRIETEIITILPKGFEPAEIKRPAGRFNLMIDNRSGLEDVSLQLDREGGARLLAAQVDRSKLDWNDVFDLAPGRYLLTEANHPEWVCFLTITQ